MNRAALTFLSIPVLYLMLSSGHSLSPPPAPIHGHGCKVCKVSQTANQCEGDPGWKQTGADDDIKCLLCGHSAFVCSLVQDDCNREALRRCSGRCPPGSKVICHDGVCYCCV